MDILNEVEYTLHLLGKTGSKCKFCGLDNKDLVINVNYHLFTGSKDTYRVCMAARTKDNSAVYYISCKKDYGGLFDSPVNLEGFKL